MSSREAQGEDVAIDVEPSATWQDGPGLSFRTADAERLPFEDDAFDVVHSKDSLHHMERPDRALAEYRRVLKESGYGLVVEANRFNPIFYPHMTVALGHEHFTRGRFRALIRREFPTARFGAFEAHYAPQLQAYRRALVVLTGLPPERVACRLLFLDVDEVREVDELRAG